MGAPLTDKSLLSLTPICLWPERQKADGGERQKAAGRPAQRQKPDGGHLPFVDPYLPVCLVQLALLPVQPAGQLN